MKKRPVYVLAFTLPLLVAAAVVAGCKDKYAAIGQTQVLIETSEGDIRVRLYDDTPLHRDNFVRLAREGAFDGVVFNRIVPDMAIQAGGHDTLSVPAEIVCPRHFHKQGALAAAREPDSINPGRRSNALQWYIVTGRTYGSAELAELQTVLYDAKVAALFDELQRSRADEIARLRATDHAAHQALLNRLQVEAEEAVAANPPAPFTEAQKQTYAKVGGAPHLDGEYTVFGEVVEGLPIALRIGRTPVDAKERPRKTITVKRVTVEK